MLLFQNVRRIDFANTSQGLPAFLCLSFIPFTSSIITGVGLGIVSYVVFSIFDQEILKNLQHFQEYYFPPTEEETAVDSVQNPVQSKNLDGFESASNKISTPVTVGRRYSSVFNILKCKS